MLRRTVLLSLPAALAACANTRSVADGTPAAANEGILVVQVSGTQAGTLGFNPYGESSFGSRFSESMFGAQGMLLFGPEERYMVRPVPAGEYMWTKLTTGNQYAWLLNSTRFRISPSTITYIGHLRISIASNKFGVRVFDREHDAREYMAAQYPQYMSAHPFQKELANVRLGA